jgi:RimJ/RimL family protein N-acetyltransferase
VGLNLHDANELAAQSGCQLREIKRDGKGFVVTASLYTNRINVETESGVVVETSARYQRRPSSDAASRADASSWVARPNLTADRRSETLHDPGPVGARRHAIDEEARTRMRFGERPDRMSEGTALYVTERLLMRPLTREQAERVVAEDRTGQAWSVGYPRTDDRDVARMFLAQDNCHDPRFGPLQIVLRDTGQVVGGIGFLGPPSAEGTVGVGYGLAPEVEGRGLATEALCGLLDLGSLPACCAVSSLTPLTTTSDPNG